MFTILADLISVLVFVLLNAKNSTNASSLIESPSLSSGQD